MTITMFDAVDVSQIPLGARAVAGYVGGRWVTYPSLLTQFPGALHLSIAVAADEDADCLDVETGDASPGQVPAWLARQLSRGAWRPCVYASASVMPAVMAAVRGAGHDLTVVRLWSAHYGQGEHICGPASCRLVNRTMDGTQWTSTAYGHSLDQSLLDDSFFPWEDVLMITIPSIKIGSTGQAVKNWQALLVAHGYALGTSGERKDGIDGVFGSVTETMTREFQVAKKITADGVTGLRTWTAALA